mgnify:CR=1 FL=1
MPEPVAITPHTILRRSSRIAWSRLGDEVLITDYGSRKSHRLVNAAATIWIAIDGRVSVSAIVAGLTAAYEVSESQAESDVRDFALKLLAHGALEIA